MRIPFNSPSFQGKELVYIAEAIQNKHISGDGLFTKKCQSLIENLLKVKKCLLTTSCTDALELAAILLNIRPGDEVIVPSFTFVSTINAFVLRGAQPVFIDVRSDNLNIDEFLIEQAITAKTKAIVIVHYAGFACNMLEIMRISKKYGITVVEDNAHGFLGTYNNQPLGTFGDLATLSFHETKNIICGEGGALIINNPDLIERAEIIREKGTNRSKFYRGQVDKYTWVDVGSSFLPADIIAAFLYAQLENVQKIQEHRKLIWQYYHTNLKSWAEQNKVKLPMLSEDCEQAYHLFYLLMPLEAKRDAMIKYLKQYEISAVFHYLPLHISPMGRKFGGKDGMCPVTESVSSRLLRLPFYNEMQMEQLAYVVQTIKNFNG